MSIVVRKKIKSKKDGPFLLPSPAYQHLKCIAIIEEYWCEYMTMTEREAKITE
jgi:hypothetical protein